MKTKVTLSSLIVIRVSKATGRTHFTVLANAAKLESKKQTANDVVIYN